MILALIVSLGLWSLPFGGFVLYPFKLLSTWVHEMWHGVAMMLTGAGFSRLEVFRDTSGLAFQERGAGGLTVAVIASAGYMGTALLGGLLIVITQRWHRPRTVLLGLSIALGLSLLFWVSNDFGQGAVALGAIALLVLARFAPERVVTFVAVFLAAQACINAVLDIRILFRPVLVIDEKIVFVSDAQSMAAATFGPPEMWAGIWMAWSFVWFYVALRLSNLQRGRADAETSPASAS